MKSKTFVVVTGTFLIACFGLYLILYFLDLRGISDQPLPEASNIAAPVIEEAVGVSLKTRVTVCQKLTETIPLAGGGAIKSSDLRLIEGFVRNNGNVAVQFVKVMIHWRDENDRIVEYEEVYAVAEEHLLPGAEASFTSSKRNSLISRCTAKVQDWWVVSDEEVDAKSSENPS